MYTASYFNHRQQQLFKSFGITMQQYNVLRILRGQYPGSASVKVLVERMIDKSSNASRLVDKLVDKNLVDRRICPHDRRQVEVRISDNGLNLLQKTAPAIAAMNSVLGALSEADYSRLSDLLDAMRGDTACKASKQSKKQNSSLI